MLLQKQALPTWNLRALQATWNLKDQCFGAAKDRSFMKILQSLQERDVLRIDSQPVGV